MCTSFASAPAASATIPIILIPGHDLVGGDVERVPDSLRVAQQPDQAFGEIGVVVITQSEEPSPGTMTFLPRRMRSTDGVRFLPAIHRRG